MVYYLYTCFLSGFKVHAFITQCLGFKVQVHSLSWMLSSGSGFKSGEEKCLSSFQVMSYEHFCYMQCSRTVKAGFINNEQHFSICCCAVRKFFLKHPVHEVRSQKKRILQTSIVNQINLTDFSITLLVFSFSRFTFPAR